MDKTCLHVLLVDDDAAIRRLITELLRDLDADIAMTYAESAGEAVEQLEAQSFDAVLLDLNLPDSTGPATVSAIRHVAPSVPIVVLSGVDDRAVAVESVKAGAQDYLVKGEFQDLVLLRTIQYAVERKRAEDAEHARRSLQQSVQSMEQVLGVVAHELRTPLAALRATTEYLLSDDARNVGEWDVFLQALHDETIRMAEMVNNLLEAARIRSGCAKWKWSTIPVRDACDEAVQLVRHMVDPAAVDLQIDVEPEDLHINGDYDAICRLVTNLLNNAARHTAEGSITVSARPIEHGPDAYVEIAVTDTGEGISSDVVERLGQAFALNRGAVGTDFTTGAGLGLSICSGIVTAHGGSMSVASGPGEGTTFRVLLRADLDAPADSETTRPIQQELAA